MKLRVFVAMHVYGTCEITIPDSGEPGRIQILSQDENIVANLNFESQADADSATAQNILGELKEVTALAITGHLHETLQAQLVKKEKAAEAILTGKPIPPASNQGGASA